MVWAGPACGLAEAPGGGRVHQRQEGDAVLAQGARDLQEAQELLGEALRALREPQPHLQIGNG